MKRLLYSALLFAFFFYSCKQDTKQPNKSVLKDSVIQEYLSFAHLTRDFATTDSNYRVLKAYATNDSTYLIWLSYRMNIEREVPLWLAVIDSCIHQKELRDIDADEAYRFIYSGGLSITKFNFTVTRRGKHANLHSIHYQSYPENTPCHILKEYDRPISASEWEQFHELMERADFWGLKKTNGIEGMDGNSLDIFGFTKAGMWRGQPESNKHIYRWNFGRLSIAAPFEYLKELAGYRGLL